MALIDRINKVSNRQELTVIPGSMQELPKAAPFSEIGVSGLLRTSGTGYVFEEFLAELSSYKQKQVYREMRDNDAVIGAMFFALEMILRRSEWRVEPAKGKKGDQYGEFVKSCMTDMSMTWEDFIAECVSEFAFGFALFETVYKRRQGHDGKKPSRFDDGLIGWRKFAPRAQESILYWIWDDEGGLQGAVQLAAPDYRTVPIPIEKLLLFRTTSSKNNPEGRSLLRNCYRCFDADSEILTKSGWKFGLDLEATDEVAVLRDGKLLEYEVPFDLPRYEYKGDLIHFESRSLDQMVTPNHEVWVRREHKEAYERVRADESLLYMRHKRDAEWVGKEVKVHTIPAYDVIAHEQNGKVNVREHREPVKIKMDDWLAFLGIYVAESCTSAGKSLLERRSEGRSPASVVVSQNEGESADEIRRILARLPFHVYEHCQERDGKKRVQFTISDRQLWDHLRVLGKARVKYVPEYVRDLSARQISIFLEAFHLGDGSMSGDAGGYEGTKLYITSSVRLADDLSELVLKVGGCPTIKCRVREKSEVQFSDNPIYLITHGRQPESRPRSITREHYEGLVWCVTTKAGVVYVRRNGKCQWSGNSWSFKRRIEEVEGIGIERDLCGLPVIYASGEVIESIPGGLAALKKMVTNIRMDNQAGVVLPMIYDDKGNPGVKLELLRSGGSKVADVNAAISRYNADMLNTILAGFVQFGESPHGSKALHMSATAIFSLAVSAFMDSIAATVNRIAIPRLMVLNRMDLEYAPKLVPGEIGVRDLNELSEYISKLAASGLTFFDAETAGYLRKIARLPDAPEEAEAPPPGASVTGTPLVPVPGTSAAQVPPSPAAQVGKPASPKSGEKPAVPVKPKGAAPASGRADAESKLQGVA